MDVFVFNSAIVNICSSTGHATVCIACCCCHLYAIASSRFRFRSLPDSLFFFSVKYVVEPDSFFPASPFLFFSIFYSYAFFLSLVSSLL